MTVYGPYVNHDGYEFVIHSNNGIRRTQSYFRYLMENELGRELTKLEEVDHIDDNPLNNDISNLQILSHKENNDKRGLKPEMAVYECPVCFKLFEREVSQVRHNQGSRGCKGPYCSKRCNGIVNH